jgi:hypothetical protein
MKIYILKFQSTALIIAMTSLGLISEAHADPYDGSWKVTTSCGTNVINKRPPFSIDNEIKISNGFIKYQWSYPYKEFIDITNWGGKVSGKSLNVAAQGNRSNGESWSYSFEGNVISPNKMKATGVLWDVDKKKARECTLEFTLIQSALSSPSRNDNQVERELDKAWLLAEKQKLEAQQAAIDSKSQEMEKKERQLREKEALLKKEKAAKDAAASKQTSSPASAPTANEKPKPVPVSSGF